MGVQFLFMDDNAPCHHTVAAEQLLGKDIERMDWTARSRISILEHVWGFFLGGRGSSLTLPPVTIQELRLALQDEWTAMPPTTRDTHSQHGQTL
ncbi:transposable element Tc3 transposase [Trichonephila clavipes]|nr:transposable element Tc3 transposase [Trichonephila clavipes]